jgi:hypothetical protein
MKYSLKPRRSAVTVIAAATILAVFGGGAAVAGGLITSAKIKDNTILSRDVHNNALAGVDVRDSSLTGADIADGSLSNGDISVYYATVAANAALVDQSGGVHVSKINTGTYAVDFGRNVTSCAFSATVGSPTSSADEGQINVADRSGNANAVFVRTETEDGTANQDHGFHLVVVC